MEKCAMCTSPLANSFKNVMMHSMLISYARLQTFFAEPLPAVEELESLLTFHAWEIDEVIPKPEFGDTIFDVKVLPDKSAWALSHVGVAREIATLLGRTLVQDPVATPHEAPFPVRVSETKVTAKNCDRYTLARIDGVKVASSPKWLADFLVSVGQRSINNIVDATNFVLFVYGQPTHVFDTDKVAKISVREARDGEKITLLGGAEATFTAGDVVISDAASDTPLAVGGVKGGATAELESTTTSILIESAHFDAVATRKTAQRLKLRTDASVRYENGILHDMAPIGRDECVKLILELAGGECVWTEDSYTGTPTEQKEIILSAAQLSSVLGINVAPGVVEDILDRMDCIVNTSTFSRNNGNSQTSNITWHVFPPFWRTDLVIPEDLIEDIARIHGLEHVRAAMLPQAALTEINKNFYYTEKIREALANVGFSEILTSSFRKKDIVPLMNSLASDKGYLRSTLTENMREALAKNAPNIDLLGLKEIRIFEIGTAFTEHGDTLALALGIRGPSGYKAKAHDSILEEARTALRAILGEVTLHAQEGVIEIDLGNIIAALPARAAYDVIHAPSSATFAPFSLFPAVSRDIAFWAENPDAALIEKELRAVAGKQLVRAELVDRFEKEVRTSLAFRFVFQSFEKTLTDDEVNADMEKVYQKARDLGFETR